MLIINFTICASYDTGRLGECVLKTLFSADESESSAAGGAHAASVTSEITPGTLFAAAPAERTAQRGSHARWRL